MNENCSEWLRNESKVTVTLCQGRLISKVKKLAAEHPEECEIAHENEDGSIVAHLPTKWIKISAPKKVSDEQREKARQRFEEYHRKRNVETR